MKPICHTCHRFFRLKKSGYYFIEAMPKPGERHPPAGLDATDKWTPYKIWSGDLWQCAGCGAEIISGVGRAPIAEHYQPDFTNVGVRLSADQFTVYDC